MTHTAVRLAILSALGPAAFAAAAQERAEQALPGTLEEVTVTAQRREQSLQSVPISVTALTADAMTASGISDLADLSVVTPGLVMTGSRGSSTPYLRGVGTQAGDPGGTSSVATYVDGVFYSAPMNGLFSFNNVERVEVIKGPQGTLFGQSATGGLIHVITKDPDQDAHGDLKLSYGNYDTTTLSLYQTVGVVDSLATDFSVWSTYQGEGFGKNIFTGEDANYRREYLVRNKWLWTPSDATRVVLSLDYGAQESDTGHVRAILPGTLGVGATPARGSGYDLQNNLKDDVDASSYTGSLRITHRFDGFDLISTTAYRHVESEALFDQDGTPIRAVDAVYREDTDSYQQEVLLNGSSGRLDWTVGAFYFKDEASVPPVTIIAGPLAALGWRIDRYAEQDLESIAGFAQGTYALTDQTRLTLGARYTSDKRSIKGRDDVVIATLQGPVTGRPTVPPGFPLVVSLTEVQQDVDFDEPTWRLALDHDLTDTTMVYASYSRGYKTGQFTVISYANPAVKPEVLDAYEAGVKADMLGRTLRLNAAAFHYDYKNIQLLSVQTGGSAIVNAAESRIRGLDLEANWIPLSNLQFTAAVSILDGEYTKYPNAEGFVANPAGGNVRIPNFDATGNDTLNTPAWSMTFAGSYSVPISVGSMTFDLTYLHSDDVTYSVDGVDVQDAYDVVNARAGFKSADERWGIALYARNLTDKQYLASVSRSTLGDLVTLSPPRTYGLEFSYRWGE